MTTAPADPSSADSAAAESTPDVADWWWMLIALNLAVFVTVFVLNETVLEIPAWLEWAKFFGGVIGITAPAVVAIAVHFDRKHVAAVSDWEPRSEYVLLGLAMWTGIGVPLAALYLYRRREHVGVP